MTASGWQMSLHVVLSESKDVDRGIFVLRCHVRLGCIFFTFSIVKPCFTHVARYVQHGSLHLFSTAKDEGGCRSKTCKQPLRVSIVGADKDFFNIITLGVL